MGEGGGGEGKGSSLPFSLPSFSFSPETPDTQAKVLEDIIMRTYASSRVKRRSFYGKSVLQIFLLIFGGHICAPKRCTNLAFPYKVLQRCVKRFGK